MNHRLMEKKYYFCANWKAQLTLEQAKILAQGYKLFENKTNFKTIIFPEISQTRDLAKIIPLNNLGWQNIAPGNSGAFTGQVAAGEAAKVAKYVLLGHSEVRQAGETDELIARKVSVALSVGLIPIVCIGESQAQYESGNTEDIIRQQLNLIRAEINQVIIAYEPVWAIGTGLSATPEIIETVANFIYKNFLVEGENLPQPKIVPILYGGSVDASKAEPILKLEHISGLLVGGASQKIESATALNQVFLNLK